MDKFNSHSTLTKSISFVLCLQGVIGVGLVIFIGLQIDFNNEILIALIPMILITLLGFGSGIFLFRKNYWAFNTSIIFYLISLIYISSEYISWSFNIGIDSTIAFNIGQAEFGIDIFSTIMLALLIISKMKVKNETAV